MGYCSLFAHHEETPTPKRNLKRETKITNATCNWIIDQVKSNSGLTTSSQQISAFKGMLLSFLKDSMETLHCANLRTTNPSSGLYKMATQCGIPLSALPANISIIVNQEKSYYIQAPLHTKTFIFQ